MLSLGRERLVVPFQIQTARRQRVHTRIQPVIALRRIGVLRARGDRERIGDDIDESLRASHSVDYKRFRKLPVSESRYGRARTLFG